MKLPMSRFEPLITGVGSDRSTNCATITVQQKKLKIIVPPSLTYNS